MKNKSIDESLEKIAELNLQTSETEESRQPYQEILFSEAKEKVEEVVSSFYVFLPHLKRQIDFAAQYGQSLQGTYLQELASGWLYINARGNKSHSLWMEDYVLSLCFKFTAKKSTYFSFESDPLLKLIIPQAEGKEKKTKVNLHLYRGYPYEEETIKLPQLADVVAEAYQQASNQGVKLFDEDVAILSYRAISYQMLLPYVISAIPTLTVNAAHHLNQQIKNKKEAGITNADKIQELKAPDLEEAIGLLSQRK